MMKAVGQAPLEALAACLTTLMPLPHPRATLSPHTTYHLWCAVVFKIQEIRNLFCVPLIMHDPCDILCS